MKANKPKRVWKLFLVAFLIFVFANMAALWSEQYFLGLYRYTQHYQIDKIELYKRLPRADVLLMGSSLTTLGLNPEVIEQALVKEEGFSIKSLNLGMSGANLDQSYLMLKNIIEEGKKPDVIVYGLADFDMYIFGKNTNLALVPHGHLLLRPDDFADYSGDTLDSKSDFLLSQFLPLYRDSKLISTGMTILFDDSGIWNKAFSAGPRQVKLSDTGFVGSQSYTELDKDIYNLRWQNLAPTVAGYSMLKLNPQSLKNFLQLAKNRGIKVILVNMPVSAIYLTGWSNQADIKKYRESVQLVATEFNVPLLDYYQNTNGLFKPEDFADPNHLSKDGAMIMSIVVARELARYFKPVTQNGKLFTANITDLKLPVRLPSATTVYGDVKVKNTSGNIWPINGTKRVNLSYHWLDLGGKEIVHDGVRSLLNYSSLPGREEQITLNVLTPTIPGTYFLEVDLLQEGVDWFKSRGNPALKRQVVIFDRGTL